jgi:hypothetical protein
MSIDVQLPDGSIAQFPNGTPEDEIEAILRAQVPQISYLRDVDRYVVKRGGIAFGFRKSHAEATELANSLPPPPLPPRPPQSSEPSKPEAEPIAVSVHESAARIDRAVRRQQYADRQQQAAWRRAERARGRP